MINIYLLYLLNYLTTSKINKKSFVNYKYRNWCFEMNATYTSNLAHLAWNLYYTFYIAILLKKECLGLCLDENFPSQWKMIGP